MKDLAKLIGMDTHDFEKVNTVKGTDIYRCTLCGLKGTRADFETLIGVTKDVPCTKTLKPKATKVKITHVSGGSTWGIEDGSEHLVVPCPNEDTIQYENDVWIKCPDYRGVTIHLLPSEYIILEP